VMDREGDICEIFKLADINRKRNPVVIRSQHNRRLIGTKIKLHETMENAPVNFTVVTEIPSQRSREQTHNKPARPYIKGRDATLSVTYQKVTIKPREHKWLKNQKPIELYAVYARELNPPEGAERIEWMLLTTLEITNQEAALECIAIYKQRWKIEDFFRILKSGCKVELHKLDDAKKLERIIAISVVIAWRIMLLTLLGRKCPELPPECFFSEDEILAMELHSKKKLHA